MYFAKSLVRVHNKKKELLTLISLETATGLDFIIIILGTLYVLIWSHISFAHSHLEVTESISHVAIKYIVVICNVVRQTTEMLPMPEFSWKLTITIMYILHFRLCHDSIFNPDCRKRIMRINYRYSCAEHVQGQRCRSFNSEEDEVRKTCLRTQ